MPSFFWFDPFLEAKAKIKKQICSFFGLNEERKFAFEIYYPLVGISVIYGISTAGYKTRDLSKDFFFVLKCIAVLV